MIAYTDFKKLKQGWQNGETNSFEKTHVYKRALAKDSYSQYTRYADDITFSLSKHSTNKFYVINDGNVEVSDELIQIINGKFGFKINKSKVRLQSKNERQIVTGLTVNRFPNVDRRFVRKTRSMINSIFRYGIDEANRIFHEKEGDDTKSLENVVLGRLLYIHMIRGVSATPYAGLASRFNSLGLDVKAPYDHEKYSEELTEKLSFPESYQKEKINRCVWIVEVDGASDNYFGCQGSAFMLAGNKLVTCLHVFSKAGIDPQKEDLPICTVYTINNVGKKFEARLTHFDEHFDLAILELVIDEKIKFDSLTLADESFGCGYRLSLVGFPELRQGHQEVACIPTVISSKIVISALNYYEVSHHIVAGHSGGPALNAHMRIIGMIVSGIDEYNQGLNRVLASEEIVKFLKTLPVN